MNRAISVLPVVLVLAACQSGTRDATAPSPSPSEPLVVAAPPIPEPRVVEPAPSVGPETPVEPAPSPVPQEAAIVTPPAPAPPSAPAVAEFKEVFPGVRVDVANKVVQFDGIVPIDAHDAGGLVVYLEVVVCTPDTKEHEAIVMTNAKASHVHAALLLIGLQPGSPGKWIFEKDELKSVPPHGPELEIKLSYKRPDGTEASLDPQQMIASARDGTVFGTARPGKWVFAGSQVVQRNGRERYDADGAGTLVGLTTFGSETIAWSEMISHEASIEEPVWIARAATVPAAGSAITVTIRPVK